MNIRAKFILIVLPLVLTPLLLTGIASAFSARNGITRIATEFLQFKAEELENYAESQWSFLLDNRLAGSPEFVQSVKAAVISFARTVTKRDTELIIGVTEDGEPAFSTSEMTLLPEEQAELIRQAREGVDEWRETQIAGVPRVAATFFFEPFGWYFLISERKAEFYKSTNQIYWFTGAISAGAVVLTVVLLLLFSSYLTLPLRNILHVMQQSITQTDLTRRVPILYRDETGELAHTFNVMIGELEKAYNQIRSYALKAAVARVKEERIRSIFQRYVPEDIINELFADPDSMLVGKNQPVAVLFSDIRGFSDVSETMRPDQMVQALNSYFGLMVDIISRHHGIVDKYIGDTIMAIFGAPTSRPDDARHAVLSALEMLEALEDFNRRQQERGWPSFGIGIGINYGPVTVGNIGSEKKMDYTVVGDMVNLASRLENLTKIYREKLLISESTYRLMGKEIHGRMVDRVIVKGKTTPVGIYTVKRRMRLIEERAWGLHEDALDLYYRREFEDASIYFREIQKLIAADRPSRIFLDRCARHLESPPAENWTGVVQIDVK